MEQEKKDDTKLFDDKEIAFVSELISKAIRIEPLGGKDAHDQLDFCQGIVSKLKTATKSDS